MKPIYNYLKLLTLFFSFMISSSEYHSWTNSTPNTKVNFTYKQPSPIPSSHYGIRNSYVQRYGYLPKPHIPSIENITFSSIHNNISALPYVHDAIKQRNTMLVEFMHNHHETHTIYFKKYCIGQASKRYLSSHDIDINTFESCEGTALQHAIHHEFVMLTDTTAQLLNERTHLTEIKQLTNVIADFTSAGISFNHVGEVTKAIALANAGWAILDCIQAAGEGIIEGVSSVGYNITHPVESVQNFTYATINCGYYCALALKELDVVADAFINGKFDVAHDKYTEWSELSKNIARAISEQCQELTLRDIIKTATKSAIECYATTRAINGFSSIFKHAHHSAAQIAKKINNGVQEHRALMSAEGINIRIAQQVLTQTNKLPRSQDKLLQVLSRFKSQKIKVGKITCLLDKKGLKHILERHHPKYWNGTLAKTQTFLTQDTTVPDIVKLIKQVIKQNKNLLLKQGVMNGQVDGVIKNIIYRVGFKQGRIGQFYIPLIP